MKQTLHWMAALALAPLLGVVACNHDDDEEPEDEIGDDVEVTPDGGIGESVGSVEECIEVCMMEAAACRGACETMECIADCDGELESCEQQCEELDL